MLDAHEGETRGFPPRVQALGRRNRRFEGVIQAFLFASATFSILITVGIIYELGKEALLFIRMPEVNLLATITSTRWQPHTGEFGIWGLVTATFMTSLIAMLVAGPLGIAVAIYLSEYASRRARLIIKPILEVLAGIPTIVYGYFALSFMTPLLRRIFGEDVVQIYNTGSAGLVMGILILPLIASMSEDALTAVPRSLREAGYGMGGTRLEVALQVVVPAALSGLAAAMILGISRAIGETMIVAVAAGAGPNFTLNPFLGAETITGHIVRISGGDMSYDSVDYNSIFFLGLLLFLITLSLNIVSQRIVRRFRDIRMKAVAAPEDYAVNLDGRRRTGVLWRSVFLVSTIVGVVALTALLLNIINGAFGYVALEARVNPDTLARGGVALESQSKDQLVELLQTHLSAGAINKLNSEQPFERRSRADVYGVVLERIVRYDVVESWNLWESLTDASTIRAQTQRAFPEAQLKFRAWLTPDFVTGKQTSEALTAGVRTAIFGTLWTILFTILVAFPIGVGAAVYLEEYAGATWINRIIQTNINNLAGVPSIVYGILGLAIFVRALEPLTSGAVFGVVDATTANGRTVLSAGLTLGLLVLPIIIINAQEAIRAVPRSLRNASYGLGATKWQTTWHHVLPSALPGILTGTILSISRAIGETAPLVVVGASTAISFDPSSPFSKFTTLPIQIYQWTARPQPEFRSLAAAAILVLLIMLLSLNAGAILLRNRYTRSI